MFFNYGLKFDELGLYDVSNKEDIPKLKKTTELAKQLDEYFSKIFPNMDLVRPIIVTSFLLDNMDMSFKDRVNYIIGIIYSKKYIDSKDLEEFSRILVAYSNNTTGESIFSSKALYENRNGFFEDIFDEDEEFINMKKIFLDEELEDANDEEEIEKMLESNSVKTIFSSAEDNGIMDLEDEFDRTYYQITPEEKICLFKENFELFLQKMLERKGIIQNNTKKEFIEKGMRDWYKYVMDIMDEMYEIATIEYDRNILDLSHFI